MGALDLAWHCIGVAAPAFGVALLTTACGRILIKNSAPRQALLAQAAINFGVCLGVSIASLALLGQDGRMAGYLALVLASATTQWLLQAGWQR